MIVRDRNNRSFHVAKWPLVALVALGLAIPALASAYSEYYGGGTICGNNCYIQSSGAHTFALNTGSSQHSGTYLACQLLNHETNPVDVVTHGYGNCTVRYGGGRYVWARVYNESGQNDAVVGNALT